MAIKNILVYFDGTAESEAALSLGLRMAEKYHAHLTGLMGHGAIEDSATRWVIDMADLGEQVRAAEAKTITLAESRFREATQALSSENRSHWLCREGRPDQVLVEASRYYDLALIGQYDPRHGKTAFSAHPDRIVLQCGRPLIVVPKSSQKTFEGRAVVAWDGQRAAARALSDAMQILETKTEVTVLTVGNGDGAMEVTANRILEHLDRHGVKTHWARTRPAPFSVANAITQWCETNPQDLLVLGAYEHSKFREDFVGGVTNTILKKSTIPVLLAH